MERDPISGRQFYYLLCLFLLGNLVTAGGLKGIHSGWLLFLLMIPFSCGLFLLFTNAAHDLSDKTFLQRIGRPAGIAFLFLYCVLAILIAGDSIRLFADFIVINDLNDAGAWGNAGLMTVIALLLLYCDASGLGKIGWALFPLCALSLIASVLLTIKNMDLLRLLPLFDTPVQALERGIIGTTAGMFIPAFFPIMVFGNQRSCRLPAFAAVVTVCTLMALLSLRDGAVLGYPAAEMFRFPGYEAAGTVRHSELLISAVFVLTQPFRTALCLLFVQKCLSDWQPRFQIWYPPIILMLSVICSILTWSSEQARWRTQAELVVILFILAGPLAIRLANKFNKNA